MTPSSPTDSPPKKNRYSYSMSNAVRFFNIFDQLLDAFNSSSAAQAYNISPSEVIGESKMTATTMQNRYSEALKYIIDNYDYLDETIKGVMRYTLNDYRMLKALSRTALLADKNVIQITFRITKTTFKTQAVKSAGIIAVTPEPSKSDGPSRFRQEVQEYLEADIYTPKIFDGLHPSESDRNWINGLLKNSPNLESFWSGANLTIVKIK